MCSRNGVKLIYELRFMGINLPDKYYILIIFMKYTRKSSVTVISKNINLSSIFREDTATYI